MLRLFLLAGPNEGNYVEPEWFAPLMAIHDRYGFILWPVLGLSVVGMIAWGVLNSMRHKAIPGEERFRCKKEIVGELRRQLNGMTLEQVARMINHDREASLELLTEMLKDNMIATYMNTKGATVYRLKGI